MVSITPTKTIADLLKHLSQFDNPKALNAKVGDKWTHISTKQYLEEVKYIALALASLGLKKGDMVGILAPSSPRWVIVDLAIMSIGCISIPIFGNISEENFLFEVKQTELKTIFVGGIGEWKIYEHNRAFFTNTISLEDQPYDDAIMYQSFLKMGKEYEAKNPGAFEKLTGKVLPEDISTIIYTSGSTGVPKGAVHTHISLMINLPEPILDFPNRKDVYLSILPLAHVYARTVNFVTLYWNMDITYFNDHRNLGIIAREIHPTLMIVVPRLMEKVYAKMLTNVENAGFMKRTLGMWAFNLANDEDESIYKSIMHPVADKIVYSALREALGGHIRTIISGGAKLNPHLLYFFNDIGIPVIEGYGLTECCPVFLNVDNKIYGSVGKHVNHTEVKISPEGEGLIKSTLNMKEYYKNPEYTREAIDKEGWLHTGDKYTIDEEGNVFIHGRIKEIFKTSTGEFVVPVPIEQELSKVPFIDTAMVVCDGRKFVSALLFPNFEVLHNLKKVHNQANLSDEEFVKGNFVRKQMDDLIHQINQKLNNWEQIRKYEFILHTLTPEAGELTPSLKVRRTEVTKKFSDEIESMYKESNESVK